MASTSLKTVLMHFHWSWYSQIKLETVHSFSFSVCHKWFTSWNIWRRLLELYPLCKLQKQEVFVPSGNPLPSLWKPGWGTVVWAKSSRAFTVEWSLANGKAVSWWKILKSLLISCSFAGRNDSESLNSQSKHGQHAEVSLHLLSMLLFPVIMHVHLSLHIAAQHLQNLQVVRVIQGVKAGHIPKFLTMNQ